MAQRELGMLKVHFNCFWRLFDNSSLTSILLEQFMNHPHIVGIHEVYIRHSRTYIVMDFVETNLMEVLDGYKAKWSTERRKKRFTAKSDDKDLAIQHYGGIPYPRTRKIVRELLSALTFIHKNKVSFVSALLSKMPC
jgi:serine/threonine protein kinase